MPRGKGHRKSPAQKKPPLTHFLCLPLVTAESKPQLEASLAHFRDDVSPSLTNTTPGTNPQPQAPPSSRDNHISTTAIHPAAIRPVGVLHCTLGVMSLNQARLEAATHLLQSLDIPSLLQPPLTKTPTPTPPTLTPPPTTPLTISLTGLTPMHAPPSTSILYTTPLDASLRLEPLCLALQSKFREAGFLVPDNRPLKLHVTIVNTIYAKRHAKPRKLGFSHASNPSPAPGDADPYPTQPAEHDEGHGSGHGPHANAPLKFDARGILERYRDFVWAEDIILDRVAICEMGAKKGLGEGGEVIGEKYVEVATVKLPGV